jgi:hypothetical protein
VGACLIAVSLTLAMPWIPALTVVHNPPMMTLSGPNVHSVHFVSIPFLIILIPLLLGFPIATTILGIAAIRDIRYSNGRIIGLPLALADALFFPLLILDGLVLIFLRAAVHGTSLYLIPERLPSIGHPLIVLAFVLGFLLCAALDYLIVRGAWRAARRPVA